MSVNRLIARGPRWLAAFAVALTLGGCTVVVRGRAVDEPPPPAKVEVRTTAPGPGYVWIDGHWTRRGHAWVWVPGQWRRARTGLRWVPGRWEQRGHRWYRVEGHWAR